MTRILRRGVPFISGSRYSITHRPDIRGIRDRSGSSFASKGAALMPSKCRLIVNGRPIQANAGETLVDAAIGGWTVIPHDCCSGQCETCRVNVVSGMIDDQGTRDGSTVLACTATVEGDAEIEFDEIPRTSRQSGILSDITPLAPDVVQLTVTLND